MDPFNYRYRDFGDRRFVGAPPPPPPQQGGYMGYPGHGGLPPHYHGPRFDPTPEHMHWTQGREAMETPIDYNNHSNLNKSKNKSKRKKNPKSSKKSKKSDDKQSVFRAGNKLWTTKIKSTKNKNNEINENGNDPTKNKSMNNDDIKQNNTDEIETKTKDEEMKDIETQSQSEASNNDGNNDNDEKSDNKNEKTKKNNESNVTKKPNQNTDNTTIDGTFTQETIEMKMNADLQRKMINDEDSKLDTSNDKDNNNNITNKNTIDDSNNINNNNDSNNLTNKSSKKNRPQAPGVFYADDSNTDHIVHSSQTQQSQSQSHTSQSQSQSHRGLPPLPAHNTRATVSARRVGISKGFRLARVGPRPYMDEQHTGSLHERRMIPQMPYSRQQQRSPNRIDNNRQLPRPYPPVHQASMTIPSQIPQQQQRIIYPNNRSVNPRPTIKKDVHYHDQIESLQQHTQHTAQQTQEQQQQSTQEQKQQQSTQEQNNGTKIINNNNNNNINGGNGNEEEYPDLPTDLPPGIPPELLKKDETTTTEDNIVNKTKETEKVKEKAKEDGNDKKIESQELSIEPQKQQKQQKEKEKDKSVSKERDQRQRRIKRKPQEQSQQSQQSQQQPRSEIVNYNNGISVVNRGASGFGRQYYDDFSRGYGVITPAQAPYIQTQYYGIPTMQGYDIATVDPNWINYYVAGAPQTQQNQTQPIIQPIQTTKTVEDGQNYDSSRQYRGSKKTKGNLGKIRFQLEYYFSEANLVKDGYLRSQMNSKGFVRITIIAKFDKMRENNASNDDILNAAIQSRKIDVSPDNKKIRIKDGWQSFAPQKKTQNDDSDDDVTKGEIKSIVKRIEAKEKARQERRKKRKERKEKEKEARDKEKDNNENNENNDTNNNSNESNNNKEIIENTKEDNATIDFEAIKREEETGNNEEEEDRNAEMIDAD